MDVTRCSIFPNAARRYWTERCWLPFTRPVRVRRQSRLARSLRSLDDVSWCRRRCDLGLTVKPRKGDALMFHSLHVNGTFDKHALHGGCPVKKGTKWVATKWIRDKCFMGSCG